MVEFKPTHSSRRINKLSKSLSAEKYLEIGVFRGDTFFNVNIDNKDGVDPNFLFETSIYETERIRFFPVSSDTFFGEFAEYFYDIIFIDGYHTFQQTFRDFSCSLSFCHRNTVWIIDDTMPSDIFSAHPNARAATQVREMHGINNRSWHGDVYKMVPAINGFFPQMQYLTICTAHNPQTAVWFEPRDDFVPQFENFESIERIDYFRYLGMREIFNIYDDEDRAIERIVDGVSKRGA